MRRWSLMTVPTDDLLYISLYVCMFVWRGAFFFFFVILSLFAYLKTINYPKTNYYFTF